MTSSQRIKMCGSKMRYDDKKAAVTARNILARDRGTKLRIYACPNCNGWHLTKS